MRSDCLRFSSQSNVAETTFTIPSRNSEEISTVGDVVLYIVVCIGRIEKM